ncbi:methyltransferase domain-containing protein [bacterium]|nr:methyltransferase domain-containing protein [bacterium]
MKNASTQSSSSQPGTPAWNRPSTMTDKEFNHLRELIYDYAAIEIKEHKRYLLINRLARRLRHLGITTFSEYLNYLKHGANRKQEFIELIDAVTTNKTDFFREPKHFTFIEQTVYPVLQQRANQQNRGLFRVWSAASSTGEEPYTIAICLAELFQRLPNWDFEIVGSDISETVLRAAVAGIFDKERVAPIPQHLLKKYFLKGNDRFKIKPELAKKVSFKKVNLKLDFQRTLSDFDIVFCRNVLIYFNRQTQEDIIQKCWHVLKPNGYLFLGHSESLHGSRTPFRYVAPSVYQKM